LALALEHRRLRYLLGKMKEKRKKKNIEQIKFIIAYADYTLL